jgi:hypothetical protein
MTHRSRLTAVLVDVPREDFEKTAAFWGAALGGTEERSEELPEYVVFGQPTPGIEFMVQSVGDPAPAYTSTSRPTTWRRRLRGW